MILTSALPTVTTIVLAIPLIIPEELSLKVRSMLSLLSRQSSMGPQEVYIFEFGAAVFWGFPKGEETLLLDFIKSYAISDGLEEVDFAEGEDDIGESGISRCCWALGQCMPFA